MQPQPDDRFPSPRPRTTKLQIEPLSGSFGAVVRPSAQRSLSLLPDDEVIHAYKRAGVIVFRGFDARATDFSAFVDRFTANCRVNGVKSRESISPDGKTQTVNVGNSLIPAHSEMGYSPFRPNMVWFHCVAAPTWRGETLLCDGVALWAALRDPVRALFESKRVVYGFRDVGGSDFDFFGHPGPPTAEDLQQLEQQPDVKTTIHPNGRIDIDHAVHAMQKPRHIDAYAFCNSVILRPGQNGSTTFEDGAPIPDELRLELFELVEKHAVMWKWQAGDIVMVDNLRVMHGRAAFKKGDRRRILVRMGDEAF